MDLLRKLALAGFGFVFVLGLTAFEANAQRSGRYYGNRTYGRSYGYNQPRYNNYRYGSYGRSNNYGRRGGLSWRERRILAYRRERMIRSAQRYYRTRNRIINRRSGYGNAYYYRNY